MSSTASIARSLILAIVALVPAAARAADRPPNLIVILADDLGYADVGFQGARDIPTPRLDALARAGVRCTAGYVSHPFCSPTRAGLLTGRYQQRFGHENNPAYLPNDAAVGLPLDRKTIADTLRAAGYATGAVGKWHLGAHPSFHPLRRGFDEWFGLIGGGHRYFDHNRFQTDPQAARQEYLIPLQRGTEPVAAEGYLTDLITREAVGFIERHTDRPFFLYLAYNAPHTPLEAPPRLLERVASISDPKRKTYAAMVCGVDDGVGAVLDALRAKGIERDTLIVFLSDNGGPISVTNCSNAPLAGAKGTLFEGGIRVPFVVHYPAKLAPGTFDRPVSSLDLHPTFAALAGKPLAPGASDGVDLLPHLAKTADKPLERDLFWRADGGKRFAIRSGDLKYVVNRDSPEKLFDLAADIGETRDLFTERPDDVARLRARYAAWNADNIAPLWSNPAPAPAKKAATKKAAAKKAAQP
ncbi:MAG: sulfatase-like hydrolase/transferase [Isosphaeraceae bacterium]|nr:sulfatase-like hydrolase/transferase [Isosphaeraceae bacterium]